jgi:hypothetical protein
MKTTLILVPFIVLTMGCMNPGLSDHLLGNSAGSDAISHSNRSYLGHQIITKTPENDAIVASPHGEIGVKAGSSTKYHILGIGFGGGTVAEAAINGNIRQITTVERQRQAYLWPVYWKTRTVVTGNGPTPVVLQTQPGAFEPKEGPRFSPLLHPGSRTDSFPPAPGATP